MKHLSELNGKSHSLCQVLLAMCAWSTMVSSASLGRVCICHNPERVFFLRGTDCPFFAGKCCTCLTAVKCPSCSSSCPLPTTAPSFLSKLVSVTSNGAMAPSPKSESTAAPSKASAGSMLGFHVPLQDLAWAAEEISESFLLFPLCSLQFLICRRNI